MRRVLAIALVAVSGCSSGNEALPPTAADLKQSASASKGVYEAVDEVCVGEGDISASLDRSKKAGWMQFKPLPNSMMSKLSDMYSASDDMGRGKVVILRKNQNRANIILFQKTTFTGGKYIHECNVYEEAATRLDEKALRTWAAVPIETRQVGDSPVYFDLVGGRFVGPGSVSATAYFSRGIGSEVEKGLAISMMRSNLSPKEEN